MALLNPVFTKRQMDGALTAVPTGTLIFIFILAHCKQIGAQMIRGEASRQTLLSIPVLACQS